MRDAGRGVDPAALALVGGTPLVRIEHPEIPDAAQIFAKAEWLNPGGSIKDRPVLAMLRAAIKDGELDGGRTVLDSSSGNAGIAYAWIGAALAVPVEVVVPANASSERKDRMRAHGATLVETDALEGYDEALREAHRRAEADPDRYWLADQYSNEHNWRAHYDGTAAEILEQMESPPTHFVAGVGTGGTITGCGRRLKEAVPGIEITMIEPERFPGVEGLKPLGQAEDIVPAILDESVVDRRVPVSSDAAARRCEELARLGLFVGLSSGAYLDAALTVAQGADPGARIVTVFSDLGERYLSTGLWSA